MAHDDTTLEPATAAGELALVILHGTEPRVVALPDGASVVLGRAAPASVIVEAPTLSREHVRITRDGTRIEIRDLASKNGIRARGARVEHAVLDPGESFEAAGVVVLVSNVRPTARARRAAQLRPDALLELIDAELSRQRITGRSFTVALIEGVVGPSLLSRLRPLDRWSLLEGSLVCLLLPEVDGADAAATLAGRFPTERVGLASSRAESSAFALVEAARRALSTHAPSDAATTSEPSIVLASAAIQEVFAVAARFAASDRPVLIVGETGTGKELVAAHVHAHSARRAGRFHALNCAAIPATLVDSTLFGHERGAFTGASERRKGAFEEASGGTLFLDELGELALPAQAALLRVLETGRLCRVGSSQEVAVDVRVVAATHRDLTAAVTEGHFRSDLLHRIGVLRIDVPPLRERPEDVVALAHVLLRQASVAAGRSGITLDPAALQSLLAHDWPGNVRELRNVIERAVLLGNGPVLTVADLGPRPPTSSPVSQSPSPSSWDLRTRLREVESEMIVAALEASGGNQIAAASLLGLPRRTLVHKIGKLGLRRRWARA